MPTKKRITREVTPETARFLDEAEHAELDGEALDALATALRRLGSERLLLAIRQVIGEISPTPPPEGWKRRAPSLGAIAETNLLCPDLKAKSWEGVVDHVITKATEQYPDLDFTEAQEKFRDEAVLRGWLIGGGVAIPHQAVPGLDQVAMAVVTIREDIQIAGPDGVPIRVAFFLLEPEGFPDLHLLLLARIAGMCGHASHLGLLLAADSAEALHNAIIVLDQNPSHARS